MEKTYTSSTIIHFNHDFIKVSVEHHGMISFVDPYSAPTYFEPDVDDATLGHAVRVALQAFRQVSVDEFQKIFKSGIVQQRFKEKENDEMLTYHYKTRKAHYKNMATCSVYIVDNQIKIQPTHQDSLDGYTVTKDEGPFPLYLPESTSDAELGAELRKGFTLCTSIYR